MKTYQHAMNIAYALEYINLQKWGERLKFDGEKFVMDSSLALSGSLLSDGKEATSANIVKWANYLEALPTMSFSRWDTPKSLV